MRILKISRKNHANHVHHRMPLENYENHGNHRIPLENIENHENLINKR